MTPDQVIDAARAATGLDDFGPDGWREGLAVYCEAADREAGLNDLGRAAVEANVVGSLANRLKVLDWAVRHPGVHGERIEAPLFVIGMFRAGTTLLSCLLDCDPANRALLRWEAGDSVPPPGPDDFRVGPRVDAARAANEMLDAINPAMSAVHFEAADGPTECLTLLGQDFKSLLWEAMTNVPSYSAWLAGADSRSAYEYHRTALQVLQSGGVRGRWTLKSPHHALALDDLVAVYPDARLVLLHRDPVELCGSVCSLIHTLSGPFSDVDHRPYIAQHWTGLLEESIRRVDSFRVAHPDHPVLDLQYRDLMADPVGTVDRIYRFAGQPLADAPAAAMRTYVEANRKGSRGAHSYSLADFGLSDQEVAERFRSYSERYGV